MAALRALKSVSQYYFQVPLDKDPVENWEGLRDLLSALYPHSKRQIPSAQFTINQDIFFLQGLDGMPDQKSNKTQNPSSLSLEEIEVFFEGMSRACHQLKRVRGVDSVVVRLRGGLDEAVWVA